MVPADSTIQTTYSMIMHWAEKTPEAIAIVSPEHSPVTYKELMNRIEITIETLNAMGIRRNDRVAIVLQNGPEMATTFLAVASGATCAPLNPQYRAEEFDFFLSDLKPKALIIETGMNSPAINIAEKRQIPIARLSSMNEDNWQDTLSLEVPPRRDPTLGGFGQPQDVALVLHTSGTTSRPKIVPLTQLNICTSANNIRRTLQLSPSDRCLNVMPLFHIHGLIGAFLSTIYAGGSIVCTPGFLAPRFFAWLRDFQPTWCTAVPSIHQAILARAKDNSEIIKEHKLRFIRSSSAALSPKSMVDLERTFNVPVIESYGMTEAAHQMASNPLPPRKRKAGTVGIAAGPEIAIMDDQGRLLSQGEVGEIVIRGASVMAGYESNPEANKKAFANGWFRTGDQGQFDQENYLTVKARIKEIINRGGEKISPREIDEALLTHPSVAQAVTFPMPDPTLGEEVAAAVVLNDNTTVTEWEIQRYLNQKLADFKVPRRVIFVTEIPKGPTGKIQRLGLAEKLITNALPKHHESSVRYAPPSSEIEKKLTEAWSEILEVDRVGVDDNFFDLGGDSIQARAIISQISRDLHAEEIPIVIFLHAPTVRKMATMLSQNGLSKQVASLTTIRPTGSKPPLYFVHACDGEVLFFADLARHLSQEYPFYALRAQGLDRNTTTLTRVDEMATLYVKEIQAFQPTGPYFLGGVGDGGIIALEMTQQLLRQSKSVAVLVLIDPSFSPSTNNAQTIKPSKLTQKITYYLKRPVFYIAHREHAKNYAVYTLRNLAKSFAMKLPTASARRLRVSEETTRAVHDYNPTPCEVRMILFLPERRNSFPDPQTRLRDWRKFAAGPLDSHIVPGEHLDILREPNVRTTAQQLQIHLDEATKTVTVRSKVKMV